MQDAIYIKKDEILNVVDTLAADSVFANGDDSLISTNDLKEHLQGLPALSFSKTLVNCKNCEYSEPIEKHSVYDAQKYLHCRLLRGESVTNVWHRYTKKYRDYSLVAMEGFCDSGIARDDKKVKRKR